MPDLPEDALIAVERGDDGRMTLRWSPAASALPYRGRWAHVAELSVWLSIWAIIELVVIVMSVAILSGRWQALGVMQWVLLAFMLTWLSGWTFAGYAAFRQLAALVRPGKDRLSLTPSVLDYKPGRYFDGREVRTGLPCRIPLSELGEIRLEKIAAGGRLIVDHGAERIEIGRTLRNSEREWLAKVLRAWAGQAERRG